MARFPKPIRLQFPIRAWIASIPALLMVPALAQSDRTATLGPQPGSAGPPSGLMVELLAMPERTTIPDTRPEFSWVFHPGKAGGTQQGYQIIVSSGESLAEAGKGDVWDSGKVESSRSVHVDFGGPSELARGGSYFWRVRTWGDSAEPGPWSGTQGFTVEPTLPQAGARSLYKASANDSTGYSWAGRYQSAYDTIIEPARLVAKGDGHYFIDFGKAGFGFATLKLDGEHEGKSIEVRFGEKADGDRVDTEPGGTIRYGSERIDLADGEVTYELRHASTTDGLYHAGIVVNPWAGGGIMPFRYVELIGCPAAITAADIRQHVLHVPFDEQAASFTSSNDTLNAVWELCSYSMKATSFASAYVDGDRERAPYEADAYINQLSHYGVDREFTTARYTYEYLLDHATWPTEWRLHFPLMAWADYLHTGDKDALVANYDSLKGQLFLDWTRDSDGLFRSRTSGNPRDIVDWPESERDGYVMTDINTVVNAFHYNALRLMAKIAAVVGRDDDAGDFTARADRMKASFNSVFWNGELYRDGEKTDHVSAHANFFPAAFGLVPEERVAAVMAFLRTKRMAPSVYGAQYLLEALFLGGEEDHAIGLMTDTDPAYKRHWWNMIQEGSTISMEAWGQQFKPNQDWNHAWGAAPGNIIPRFVLGLKPLTPGFGSVEIRPQLGTGDGEAGLTEASGTIPTIRGPVEIGVENSLSGFKLTTTLPGNMQARVLIPTKGFPDPVLVHNGRIVKAPVSNGHLVLESLPSGKHAIWLSESPAPGPEVLEENLKSSGMPD